jgi:hypothetical protein
MLIIYFVGILRRINIINRLYYVNKSKFSIQFSHEKSHSPPPLPPPISKTIRAGEKLNTDLESAAQTLSNFRVCLLDEFPC